MQARDEYKVKMFLNANCSIISDLQMFCEEHRDEIKLNITTDTVCIINNFYEDKDLNLTETSDITTILIDLDCISEERVLSEVINVINTSSLHFNINWSRLKHLIVYFAKKLNCKALRKYNHPFIVKNGNSQICNNMISAAIMGHTQCIPIYKCFNIFRPIEEAVIRGDLKFIIEFTETFGGPCVTDHILDIAVSNNNTNIINFFKKHPSFLKSSRDCNSIQSACSFGCMKRHHKNGENLTIDLAFAFAKTGNLQAMKYLLNNRCKIDSHVIVAAIIRGHNAVALYLIKNGVRLSPDVLYVSLLHRMNSKFVKLLLKRKCPMNAKALSLCIHYNDFKTFKLLIENKCPIKSYVMTRALNHENCQAINLLLKRRCQLRKTILKNLRRHVDRCANCVTLQNVRI